MGAAVVQQSVPGLQNGRLHSLPSKPTNADPLILQIGHFIDVVAITACYDCPSQRVVNPVTDDLISPIPCILRLLFPGEASDPALGQPDANVDLIAAQRGNHMARSGRERGQVNLEWKRGDRRGAEGQV